MLVLELLISTAISSSPRDVETSAEKTAAARSRESRRLVFIHYLHYLICLILLGSRHNNRRQNTARESELLPLKSTQDV